MQIMTSLANGNFPDFLERAKLVERVGLHGIGVGDTPLSRDPYVSLTAAATVTSRIRLGPIVTNPITRHPAVTASAISSLNDLSGGRAFLGLSSGDSAARHRGLAPAKLADMRSSIAATRDLLSGNSTTWRDAVVGAQWTHGPVPILMAADGQRTMRVAGELADAVLIGTGIDSAGVSSAITVVREGEALAGRPPGSVAIWFVARTAVAPTAEEGYQKVKVVLSVAANHVLHAELKADRISEELRQQAQEYCDRYSYEHHGVGPENPNVDLFESLGMRDYIVGRFAVTGNSSSIAAEYSRLSQLGVDGVLVPAVMADADELICSLGEEVMPQL